MIKNRTINVSQEPTIRTYKNPKHNVRLEFDRHNESYKIIRDVVKPLEPCKSFKDFIIESVKPPMDSDASTYGVARKMEPLTQTINKMKDTLEHANKTRQEMIIEHQKKIIELQQEEQEKGAPIND